MGTFPFSAGWAAVGRRAGEAGTWTATLASPLFHLLGFGFVLPPLSDRRTPHFHNDLCVFNRKVAKVEPPFCGFLGDVSAVRALSKTEREGKAR